METHPSRRPGDAVQRARRRSMGSAWLGCHLRRGLAQCPKPGKHVPSDRDHDARTPSSPRIMRVHRRLTASRVARAGQPGCRRYRQRGSLQTGCLRTAARSARRPCLRARVRRLNFSLKFLPRHRCHGAHREPAPRAQFRASHRWDRSHSLHALRQPVQFSPSTGCVRRPESRMDRPILPHGLHRAAL